MQGSKPRATRGLGVKSNKSLKCHISIPKNKLQFKQSFSSPGSSPANSNGNKFSQVDHTAMIGMGDMVQEQGGGNLR